MLPAYETAAEILATPIADPSAKRQLVAEAAFLGREQAWVESKGTYDVTAGAIQEVSAWLKESAQEATWVRTEGYRQVLALWLIETRAYLEKNKYMRVPQLVVEPPRSAIGIRNGLAITAAFWGGVMLLLGARPLARLVLAVIGG